MLIVAPCHTAAHNSAHSEDSRSTSASAYSIQPISGKSREKLNNFSDSSAFSEDGRRYLRAQGSVARLGGTWSRKKATDASEGI